MKIANRPLAIYKYLCDSTDEEHYATIVGITDYLAPLGIEANRKTVVNDCRQLQECGYDVVCTRSRQNK